MNTFKVGVTVVVTAAVIVMGITNVQVSDQKFGRFLIDHHCSREVERWAYVDYRCDNGSFKREDIQLILKGQ